jgi:hypothetical protein
LNRLSPIIRQHIIPIFVLLLYGFICNTLGLKNFDQNLAFWGDDNTVYYSERSISREIYPGDFWHNSFQAEYVWLSLPYWMSMLLNKYVGVAPSTSAFIFTSLKVWLLTGSGYLLAYRLSNNPWRAMILGLGLNSSNILWWNLANFGYWYYMPYQSDLAYPLVLISLFFIIDRRLIISLSVLAVATAIQPAIGMYGCFFMAFIIFFDRPKWDRKHIIQACVGAIIIFLIAFIPSRLVLMQIPPTAVGEAKVIYQSLNKTHGGLWEWAGNVWWVRVVGLLSSSFFVLPAIQQNMQSNDRGSQVLKLTLASSLVLVALGILSKAVCILLLDTPYLKFVIIFHQLLMTRASVFTLIIAFLYGGVYCLNLFLNSEPPIRFAATLLLFILVDMRNIQYEYHHIQLFFVVCLGLVVPLLIKGAILSASSSKKKWFIEKGVLPTKIIMGFSVFISFSLWYFIKLRDLNNSFIYEPFFWIFLTITSAVLLILPNEHTSPHTSLGISAISLLGGSILTIGAWKHIQAPYLSDSIPLIFLPFLPFISTLESTALIFFSWVKQRRSIIITTAILTTIVLASIQNAANFKLASNDVLQDWYDISLWARDHTRQNTSFLNLLDYSPPGGWRTYSHRGIIKMFGDSAALVYLPDLRLTISGQLTREYLAQKYPNMNSSDIYNSLDEDDLKWAQANLHTSYAIASANLKIDYPIIYRNKHFTLYDLEMEKDKMFCQSLTSWLIKNSFTNQTILSDVPCKYPAFIQEIQKENNWVDLKDLLNNNPDLVLITDDNIQQMDMELKNLFSEEQSFLNYDLIKVFDAPSNLVWSKLYIYRRAGPSSLNGKILSVTGSPLYPSPNGTDVLELDDALIPMDVYLSASEGSPFPYVLDITLKAPMELSGIGFVWWSPQDQPREGRVQGWKGDQLVFDNLLSIQSSDSVPYSWEDVGNKQVDRLVLTVSSFKGQQRLILRRLIIDQNNIGIKP